MATTKVHQMIARDGSLTHDLFGRRCAITTVHEDYWWSPEIGRFQSRWIYAIRRRTRRILSISQRPWTWWCKYLQK